MNTSPRVCAVDKHNQMKCWEYATNLQYEMIKLPNLIKVGVKQVEFNSIISCAVLNTNDNQLLCWSTIKHNQMSKIITNNIKLLSLSEYVSCAINLNNKLICFTSKTYQIIPLQHPELNKSVK